MTGCHKFYTPGSYEKISISMTHSKKVPKGFLMWLVCKSKGEVLGHGKIRIPVRTESIPIYNTENKN